MSAREAAWDAVHEALPARCRPRGRLATTQTVTGTGPDEVAALRDLDARLRGKPPAGSRLEELRQRLRLAYVDGAESWTRENVGRGLSAGELDGVIARFPR